MKIDTNSFNIIKNATKLTKESLVDVFSNPSATYAIMEQGDDMRLLRFVDSQRTHDILLFDVINNKIIIEDIRCQVIHLQFIGVLEVKEFLSQINSIFTDFKKSKSNKYRVMGMQIEITDLFNLIKI